MGVTKVYVGSAFHLADGFMSILLDLSVVLRLLHKLRLANVNHLCIFLCERAAFYRLGGDYNSR
jgi:hypothetical protein